MWRKLNTAIENLIVSDDYAKEYVSRREVEYMVRRLINRNDVNKAIFIPKGFQ